MWPTYVFLTTTDMDSGRGGGGSYALRRIWKVENLGPPEQENAYNRPGVGLLHNITYKDFLKTATAIQLYTNKHPLSKPVHLLFIQPQSADLGGERSG
jgi:hypothetical protein